MSIAIIGVDPGVSGALCLVVNSKLCAIFDMPVLELPGKKKLVFDKLGNPIEKIGVKHEIDPHGVRRVMANWRDYVKAPCTFVIEKMWGRAGQDVVSTSNLMYGAGLVTGVAIGLNFGVERIAPATWKSKLGVSADKKSSLDLARELAQSEPDEAKWTKMFARKMDNNRAESYLIAKFGDKLVNGG